MAGYPGYIGSMDATHVGMLKCYFRFKQFNDSWKLNMLSRTYNVTVIHRRKNIHTTSGHPGRWNDQTLQLYNMLAKLLQDGNKYNDVVFVLLQTMVDSTISHRMNIVVLGYLLTMNVCHGQC